MGQLEKLTASSTKWSQDSVVIGQLGKLTVPYTHGSNILWYGQIDGGLSTSGCQLGPEQALGHLVSNPAIPLTPSDVSLNTTRERFLADCLLCWTQTAA